MEDLSVNKKLNFLYGGGEMGERIRNFDWSKTPLGNPENWDSSLKTCVRIVLTSSQPMFIWWGDKLINIYNDACKGVLGRKHPAMLGVTGKIVWDEVWDELWTRGKTVFENNQGTFDDALLLIMNRNGYEEETYFKFSFNPIPGTIKTTEGLLCVSTEETSRIYNERALDMLRELGAITYTEKSLDIIYRHVAEALATNHKDFPFALIYKITGDANIVTVVASTGIDKSQNVFPDNIDITKPTAITKDFCQAFKENKMVVSEIQAEDVTLPTGAWQTTPKQFIHLPISPAGSKQPYCIISAALNPYRTFDEKYLQFCQLIADRISTEINKMLAIEVEAKRAEAKAEIDRAKIVVFSNIIHEFRTPLTLILSPLEEILNQKKNNLNKTEKQNIEIAHRNSMRLFDMVNNLLDFSNIEKGELNKGSVFTVKIPFDQQHVSEHQIIGTEMNADEITSDTYIAKIEISLETEKNETVQIVAVKEKNILPTVLVVDDNADVRKHISTILSENFNVITANHGMDALLLIRKTTPDLVISDIWMYVMDGISLLKEIKSDKATANIPVILLIASAGENSKVSDWKMGADDYMVKPFSAKELVARVKAQLRMVKLRQSLEGNVRNLFLQSPVAIAILKGPQHIFELANDMYMHLAQNNDVVGKSIRQVFPELEGTAIYELLDHVYSTGEPFVTNEMLVKLNKGNEKLDENYFNLVYQPSRDKDGKIDGVITHGVDVTEQVLARKKIEESEHRYHEIIYTSPSLIAIFKGEDMIIDIANDAILDSWGKGNIIGKSIFDVMPESIEQGFDKLLLSVYRTGESILGNEVPATFYRKGTKEIIYYNFVYQAQRNVHGEIEGVATIATEVTSQAELNKKIKESEEQFRNVWLQSPNIFVILKGPEMVIDFVNEPLLRSWGRTNDIVGKTILEALPETKHQAFPRLLEEVYKTGKTYFGKEEKAVIIKDDEPEDVYYNYVYQAIQEDGKVSGITVMATDVTEQVVARKKIEESEKQQAFMLKLSDALRPLSNPVDIEEAVTKIALDFMEADWCHYCTIDGDNLIILRDAVRGDLPHLVGEYQISNYPLFNNILSAGCASVVHDVHTTDLLDEDLKQLCMQLQNISFINVPVVKNGKPVGLLSIVQSKPRKWTDSEVQLTIETAERTWAAVERAKVEEALRKSEEKYRTLFTSIDQGFVLCELIRNKEGKGIDYYMLELNPTYEMQTGLSIEMMLGKTILQVFPTIDKKHIETFAAVVDNQCPVEFEQYFEVNQRWHAVKVYPGEKNKFTVLFKDITQHKQAEEKLRESESRFRKMADASPMFIWTLDANGLSSYYNKTFLDFLGVSKDKDISDWKKIVHPDDIQSTIDTINTAIAECRSYALECRLLRADGQWRSVLAQGNPSMGDNNEFLGFVGSSVDITERKQAEEELTKANIAAENATKSKQQFLSNMSHEIRTPLNSIIGFANVLLKTKLDVEQKEFLQAIKTSGKSLNLLIDDILDLAKVDTGKMTFEKQPFEIRPLISSVLHSFDLKIKEKNLKLVEEYDNKIPSILLGDSLRLNQIFLNLLGNAVKFTHKGRITLSVKLLNETQESVTLEFTLTDSGIGIAANKMDLIFNLFEQAELSTSNSYGGTGLGLAIVKQLIQAQGGSINVKSKLGEGSTFSFILPFGKTSIKLEEEIDILKLGSEIKIRVLVAEDVALNQLLIKLILSDFGFEYEIVDNGRIAIERMQNNTYDIILMDLQMPEMNGFETTEYIRKTMKSEIPIIALTADVTTVDVEKCKGFGMDDYISKPINENLLYGKIMELVKKKP